MSLSGNTAATHQDISATLALQLDPHAVVDGVIDRHSPLSWAGGRACDVGGTHPKNTLQLSLHSVACCLNLQQQTLVLGDALDHGKSAECQFIVLQSW